MAPAASKTVRPPSAWRLAGMATVLLAIGLSGVGVLLALSQVRQTTIRVMTQTKLRASQIASQASDRAQQGIDQALQSVADQLRGLRRLPPAAGLRVPAWVSGVLAFRDGALVVIDPPPGGDELARTIESRQAARSVGSFGLRIPGRTELHFERAASEPVVVAWADFLDSASRPVTIALTIDSRVLAGELLDAAMAADEALELAPASRSGGYWDQPLPGALKYWSIRPSEDFVQEQRNTVLAQTLVYVGLTSLALLGLLVALGMLTRLVRREVALAELKSNFVADVSHELKTPLALIRLYAETLQSGRVPSDEKRREYYDIIARESTRLTNLINNILDFSRIEAGRKEYTLEPIDAVAVVRETYEAYRPQLEQAGFDHYLTIGSQLPRIDADRDAVSQILVNLIHNSIKYSSDEKFLQIELTSDIRRGRRGILISVHDCGIGIRPEDRAFLTEGFYRARDPHVRQQGGTGLGLALVRHIVEVHGGSLDIESRLVKGSTFRVFLPASSAPAAPGEQSAAGPAALGTAGPT